MSDSRQNLIPGTLNLLILRAVSRGPGHGYGISKWISARSKEVLQVEEGVLYPALHRLEQDGYLESEWGRNDTGRRAKFYTLTPSGEEHLEAEQARWRRTSRAVETVISVEGA